MKATGVDPKISEYLAAHRSAEDPLLEELRRETRERFGGLSRMQISAEQGLLLHMLAATAGARRTLEVGTFTGYSAICIARGLGDSGRLTCLELDAERAAIAQANLEAAGVADRVDILIGPAGEALEAMAAAPAYDFAFIDADKAGYPEYYELVLPRMRHGGLILLDNMLQGGQVLAPDTDNARVIDDLNRRIHADERVDMAMTVSADGLTFARVR